MNKIYLLFFFLSIQQNLYSETYAVFIPDNDSTNVYTYNGFNEIHALSYIDKIYNISKNDIYCNVLYDEKIIKIVLFHENIPLHHFYFYQEKLGAKSGRRRLFADLNHYNKIFVFENLNKFKSYRAYSSYLRGVEELELQYKKAFSTYEHSRKSLSKYETQQKLERVANRIKSDFDLLNEKFEFYSLDVRPIFFFPEEYNGSVYKYQPKSYEYIIDKENVRSKKRIFDFRKLEFHKKDFDKNDLGLSYLFFNDFKKEDLIKDNELILPIFEILERWPEDTNFYYYQEGNGNSFGRRRLIKDIKNSPYKICIYCFENKERFIKKIPKLLQDSFEINYCNR